MSHTELLEWWLKTGSMYGLGMVAVAGLIFIILYALLSGTLSLLSLISDLRKVWIPKAVAAHLSFMEGISITNSRTSEAVEKLTATHYAHTADHRKTHKALYYMARAQQMGLSDNANKELDKAIKELSGEE